MYCVLLAHMSIPPAAELSIPICTPTTDGLVGFVDAPMHETAPHFMPLIAHVELVDAYEGEAFLFTCILKSLCVIS